MVALLQVYHSHDPGRLIADMTGQTGGDRVWYGGRGRLNSSFGYQLVFSCMSLLSTSKSKKRSWQNQGDEMEIVFKV